MDRNSVVKAILITISTVSAKMGIDFVAANWIQSRSTTYRSEATVARPETTKHYTTRVTRITSDAASRSLTLSGLSAAGSRGLRWAGRGGEEGGRGEDDRPLLAPPRGSKSARG